MSPRRIPHRMEKLKIMIREVIEEMINEIYDKPIVIEYKKLLEHDYEGYILDIYRFKTDAGNSYDADFLNQAINTNKIILFKENDKKHWLSSILKNEFIGLLDCIELGFTPTEFKDIDVEPDSIGTMDDPYINRTDRKEQYELLNRMSFLIQEYIKNNPNILIYSIGKNTHENNLSSYSYIFNKIFENNYSMFEVYNPNFTYGSYYFINKKTLK